MLETIKATISQTANCIPFEQFFDLYVMSIQDANIITEIEFNIHRNNLTILDIERLAQDQHERLVNSN